MISPPEYYINRFNTITQIQCPPITNTHEAKLWIKQLIQMQKELRLLKKELNAVKKEIRDIAKTAAKNAAHGFVLNTVNKALLGKGKERSLNAADKRNAEKFVLQNLAPYESIDQHIDQVLVKIDADKVRLESWILQFQR
jgi:hypothetical protein